MAKSELGGKHKCQNCGTKFFDLNKDPIVCPKCGTTLEVAAVAAGPTRSAPRASAKDDDEVETDGDAEVVSLEEADDADDGKVKAPVGDDDVEEDDSPGDDDSFLEEDEEEDGNVSDLIDSDIEDDEER